MAELDTLWVHNPLPQDFKWRYNGEMYSVPAENGKSFPQGLAFHMAKHLSDACLAPQWEKLQKEKASGEENQRVNQAVIYDTPQRRIALYDILGSKELVQECINAFNFKGFIGEMSVYDEYVEKEIAKKAKKEGKKEETVVNGDSTPAPTATVSKSQARRVATLKGAAEQTAGTPPKE